MYNQDKQISHQNFFSENASMQHPHKNTHPEMSSGMNYAQMFASTGVGIVVVRPDGIIEWANQETAKILGHEDPQNVINKSVRVFLVKPEMTITWLQELYDTYSPAIPLEKYLAHQDQYFTHTPDWNGFWNRKLDYLFTNQKWIAHSDSTHQDATVLSDHCPVSARLRLPK